MDADEHALYRETFEEHPAIKLLLDPATGGIHDANPAAAAFYGYGREAMQCMNVERLETHPAGALRRHIDAVRHRHQDHCVAEHRLASGDVRDVEIESALMRVGGREYIYAIVHDITERVRYQRALEDYRAFFNHLPVAFYRAMPGPEGRFLRVNPAMVRLFEAPSAEALMEIPIASLYADAGGRQHFSDTLLAQGEVLRHEIRMRTLEGNTIWVADTAHLHQDEDGRQVFDGVLEDITRRRQLEQELAHQAAHDELTGLYNRRWANSLLQNEIQRVERYGHRFAALMFDLDHFKTVNDTHGHAMGDAVLTQVVRVVTDHLRETDLPGRWGGEEFLVLLPGTDAAGMRHLAECLRAEVAELEFPGVGVVTISIGCAGYRPGEGADAFLGRLDDALYAAKNAGRNRVVVSEDRSGWRADAPRLA